MELNGWQGRVACDGQRVTVSRWLRGTTTIPTSQIGSVEIVRAGIGFRAIRFSTQGGTLESRRRSPLGSYTAALRDPYAVLFRSGRRQEFETFRDEVLSTSC